MTRTARIEIEKYQRMGLTAKNIAARLGVHISTIYREVKRGRYEHLDGETWLTHSRYSPEIAQERYEQNLKAKGGELKIGNDRDFAEYIEKRIVEDKLSPAAVLGEIKHLNLPFKTSISVNTLYSYIDKGVFLRLTNKNLPMRHRKKRTNKRVRVLRPPRGESIERRPKEITERRTFGHWEMDCVIGRKMKSTLLVLTERLTRQEIILPIPAQKAEFVVKSLDLLEKRFGKTRFPTIFQTITVDNGSEFADCAGLEKSHYGNQQRTKIYYCHPYCSSERGTNERLNREIRRIFPKGTDFRNVSRKQIQACEDWINSYPRAVLDYATSKELFEKHVSAL